MQKLIGKGTQVLAGKFAMHVYNIMDITRVMSCSPSITFSLFSVCRLKDVAGAGVVMKSKPVKIIRIVFTHI